MAGSTGTAGSDGCTSFEGERMASFDQRVCSIPNVQWRASQTLNFAHVSSAPLRALVDFEWLNTEHKRTRPTLSAPPGPPIWISNGKKSLALCLLGKTLDARSLQEKRTIYAASSFRSVIVNCWPRLRLCACANRSTGTCFVPVSCSWLAIPISFIHHSFIIHL